MDYPNAVRMKSIRRLLVPNGALLRRAAGRTLLGLGAAWVLGIWCLYLTFVYRHFGVYNVIGFDWGILRAGALAFVHLGHSAPYDIRSIALYHAEVLRYYSPSWRLQIMGLVPYPPLLVALLIPFALLPPLPSFVAWSLFNLILGTTIVIGMVRCTERRDWIVGIISIIVIPSAEVFVVGQITMLLVAGLAVGFWLFTKEREYLGGAAVGGLLLKPQYAVFLVAVLVLKQRWSAVVGVVTTGVAIASSTLVVLGPKGTWSYIRTIAIFGSRIGPVISGDQPWGMMGWRALLLNLLPPEYSGPTIILTLLLSTITCAILVPIWRGPWDTSSPRFALQLAGTFLVTLLSCYDSQIHGGALLIIPALAVLGKVNRPTSVAVVAAGGAFIPPMVFLMSGFSWPILGVTMTVWMTIALVTVTVTLRCGLAEQDSSSALVSEPLGEVA